MLEEVVIIAIVIGITQVAKQLGMPNRFSPVLAIICGIGIAFVATMGGFWEVVLQGVIVGLTAAGLWDLGKVSILGK